MRTTSFVAVLTALTGLSGGTAHARDMPPHAEFLFIGSYHMGNPGRDVRNTRADDVLSDKRQREIKDEGSIDYRQAVARHQQEAQYEAHLAIGRAENEKEQALLDSGTVLAMLRYLNSAPYRTQNAMGYYRIGMLGTPSDPIGANWVQLWFGRNLAIFNNISRHAEAGDRVLVIDGAGHGNLLRQLAIDSGIYRVHEPIDWLSPTPSRH